MLESTEKGGVRNSIRNCLTVFQNDPLLSGAIAKNLLTELASSVNSEVRIRLSVYFFTSGEPPLVFLSAVSRARAADRYNAKKAHSGFCGPLCGLCSAFFL